MMRLTRVELRRLFSRRLTTIAIVGAVVVTGLMLFGAFKQAQPLSGADLTSQRVQFEQMQRDWATNGQQQVQDCLKNQSELRKQEPKVEMGCNQLEPKWGVNFGTPKATFSQLMGDLLRDASYPLAFVGFLLGASFFAAELSSGSMGNWLTFEPRRLRVYASKLVALCLGLGPVVVMLLGLLSAGTWLIAGHFGLTGGLTAAVWGDLGKMAGRSLALALAAAVVGAAVGGLLRHTAAVLGVAIGYLVLAEGILAGLLPVAHPWLLKLNMDAWLQHDATYFVQKCAVDSFGQFGCQSVEKILTFGHGSAYLGVLVVFVVGLAALVFRRRDVS
jgi:ABC-2 type transport system permease protein